MFSPQYFHGMGRLHPCHPTPSPPPPPRKLNLKVFQGLAVLFKHTLALHNQVVEIMGGGGKTICLPPNIFMGWGDCTPATPPHPPPPPRMLNLKVFQGLAVLFKHTLALHNQVVEIMGGGGKTICLPPIFSWEGGDFTPATPRIDASATQIMILCSVLYVWFSGPFSSKLHSNL